MRRLGGSNGGDVDQSIKVMRSPLGVIGIKTLTYEVKEAGIDKYPFVYYISY